ncbi:hypothetical protein FQN55_009467 [Onygenales sp. PD_40]|nr:hypothetical protein FQN55_009467 [Onygenales sp. PD_40]KAK2785250.1 hypothetical protein FQN52_008590 [Onygenales sp. PD_12]KAK2794199.1 hypothetical protein FQN51_000900 [Onygenales sp. PD_10]
MSRTLELELQISQTVRDLEAASLPIDNPAAIDADSAEGEWTYPEGGCEAWMCLLGSAALALPSFGFQVAVGSVQDYMSTHQLAEYTVRDVGWITALFVFITLFLGVHVGPLFDRYGPRYLLMVGTSMSFLSYMLLAECSKYWHFIVSMGLIGGVACAIVTTVAISAISHWFYRRRALASGLCMGGPSLGGALIPLVLRNLFPRYGWTWAIRILGFIALGFYAIGIFFVKGRLPRGKTARATIDVTVFSSPRVSFLAVGVLSFEFIIFGLAALLPTYVRYAGFPVDTQFYSLTILNSLSFLGRTIPGFVADKVGRFNILLVLMAVTLTIMAGVWLPVGSRDEALLYAVLAVFGFGSGGWISLAPVCAGQLCRTEEYGRFYGTIYLVAAFGVLLTVPIGGQLIQSTTPQVLVGFYAAVLLVGLVSVAASRWALLDWKWKWKVKV